jgi:hypothetical protein
MVVHGFHQQSKGAADSAKMGIVDAFDGCVNNGW